jgi:hypothetical protein
MATIAILVCKFDWESERFVNLDGSKSERGSMNDESYFGTASILPNWDLKIN